MRRCSLGIGPPLPHLSRHIWLTSKLLANIHVVGERPQSIAFRTWSNLGKCCSPRILVQDHWLERRSSGRTNTHVLRATLCISSTREATIPLHGGGFNCSLRPQLQMYSRPRRSSASYYQDAGTTTWHLPRSYSILHPSVQLNGCLGRHLPTPFWAVWRVSATINTWRYCCHQQISSVSTTCRISGQTSSNTRAGLLLGASRSQPGAQVIPLNSAL